MIGSDSRGCREGNVGGEGDFVTPLVGFTSLAHFYRVCCLRGKAVEDVGILRGVDLRKVSVTGLIGYYPCGGGSLLCPAQFGTTRADFRGCEISGLDKTVSNPEFEVIQVQIVHVVGIVLDGNELGTYREFGLVLKQFVFVGGCYFVLPCERANVVGGC